MSWRTGQRLSAQEGGREAHADQQALRPTLGPLQGGKLLPCPNLSSQEWPRASAATGSPREGVHSGLGHLEGSSSDTRSFTTISSAGLSVLGALLPPVPALLACVSVCTKGVIQSTRTEKPGLSGSSLPGVPQRPAWLGGSRVPALLELEGVHPGGREARLVATETRSQHLLPTLRGPCRPYGREHRRVPLLFQRTPKVGS